MDHRYGRVEWGPHGERVRTSEQNWRKPISWDRAAKKTGTRTRVFCASLADVFDNKAPEGAREDLFELIRDTPNLDWLLLTKRPENIRKMLPGDWGDGYENVWLGTSAEDQPNYNRRWPKLRAIPAKVHFISYEPALGPLSPSEYDEDSLPDWIICGGETGNGSRFMKKRWARNLLQECQDAKIAFFMKQMTDKAEIPADLLVRQSPSDL